LLLPTAQSLKVTLTRNTVLIDTQTLALGPGGATYTADLEARVPHGILAQAYDASGNLVFQGSTSVTLFGDRSDTLYLFPVKADGSPWTTIAASAQPTGGVFAPQATPATGASLTYLVDLGSTAASFTFAPHTDLELYVQNLDGTLLTPLPATITPSDLDGETAFWATYYQKGAGTVGNVGSFVIPLQTLTVPASFETSQAASTPLATLLTKYPSNATNGSVTWTVADPSVATIDALTGVLTTLIPASTPASTTVTVSSVADPSIKANIALQVFGPEFSRLGSLTADVDAVPVALSFLPGVFTYPLAGISSSALTQTLTVKATEGYPGQVLTWSTDGTTWTALTSGAPSNIPLVQGSNDVRIQVLAKNNSDTNVYHLVVNKVVLPASYTLTPASQTITTASVGTKFTATVAPSVADDPSVTWESSDPSIATVHAVTGIITPLSAGTVTITARSVANPAVTGTASCTVEQVTSASLNLQVPVPGTLSLSPGSWTVPQATRLVLSLTGSLATTGTLWLWTAGGTVLDFLQTGTSFDLDTSALATGTYDLTVEVMGPDSVFYSGSAVLEVTP